jgi:hypothetical protein
MKKRIGKIKSYKKLNKSNLFFKILFPVLLAVLILLLGIILLNIINPTGNIITGYDSAPAAPPSTSELNSENVPSSTIAPAAPPSTSELNSENVPSSTIAPAAPPSELEKDSANMFNILFLEENPLWMNIITGIVILLILIGIYILIKKFLKR